jgi:hypothetical protein
LSQAADKMPRKILNKQKSIDEFAPLIYPARIWKYKYEYEYKYKYEYEIGAIAEFYK